MKAFIVCDSLVRSRSVGVLIMKSSSFFPPKLWLCSILWPLFHYHPGEISFNEEDWGAYQQANTLFAKAITEIVREGDLVWVQDYHLMLLPKLLREEIKQQRIAQEPVKNIKIGFFLHTPFPSSEVYR